MFTHQKLFVPITKPIARSKAPPIILLCPVACIIFIFFEATRVMMPPSAAQPAFRRIIPSPLNVIFSKKSVPGCIFIVTIPAIPNTHPNILGTDILSSEKIIVERIIKKKTPIEFCRAAAQPFVITGLAYFHYFT